MADSVPNSTFNIFEDSKAVVEDGSSELVYLFRYNVVSDEGDVVTEWSTVNQLNQTDISNTLGTFTPTYSISSVESGGVGINAKWTVPDSFIIKQLDIYFSWSYDGSTYTDYEYADTVSSNNYYIDIPFNILGVQTPTGTTNITFTTAYPHGVTSGQAVTVSGVTPTGYNGNWVAQSGTTGSALVLNIGSNPGAITTAGKINKKAKFVKVVVQTPTNAKVVNTNALLFESDETSTLPVLDAGTIV